MSAEVYTFGYVPSDLTTRTGGFVATATTRPTYDETVAIIYEVAAEWCGFLLGYGIDPAEWNDKTASVVYGMSRRYIGASAAARCMRAKDRNDQDLCNRWDEEARQTMKVLAENPSKFASARPTGPDAANLAYVWPVTDPNVLRAYANAGTVSQRSAAIGRM